MIVVVDYGVNNLRSVVRALAAAGHAALLSDDPATVAAADRVVMPGVGHFGTAARTLSRTGLGEAVRTAALRGRPVLGICLGLQLFFAASEEAPEAQGLGLLPGRVARFAGGLPVPHVGWAEIRLTESGRRHPLFGSRYPGAGPFFYHIHSYHPTDLAESTVLAQADYGGSFPTIVGRENVLGVQFHPEKSQQEGIRLLGAFAEWPV